MLARRALLRFVPLLAPDVQALEPTKMMDVILRIGVLDRICGYFV
jgi:hypothetical protein